MSLTDDRFREQVPECKFGKTVGSRVGNKGASTVEGRVYNLAMCESGASFGGQTRKKFEGAGGTPGGVGEFIVGVLLAGIGFYIVFSHVQVHSSYWNFFGAGGAGRSFGVSLIPLLFGIGLLFANGSSLPGWVLTIGGLLLILVGIIVNLDIYFQPTSLMNTIIMLGLIAAGFGLVVKSLRPHKKKSEETAG